MNKRDTIHLQTNRKVIDGIGELINVISCHSKINGTVQNALMMDMEHRISIIVHNQVKRHLTFYNE